jgi:hypothetical protein
MIKKIDMMYHKLLLCIILTMYFIAQAQALPPMLVGSNDLDWAGNSPGDPLDPGFVGETMDMPLDPDIIQKAREAGIIKDASSPRRSASGSGAAYLGTPFAGTEFDGAGTVEAPAQAGQNVNVTGPWSLDLIALDQVLRHMDLALVQNKDVVMGYGAVIGGDDTQRVTASGSKAGNRLSLTVMPVNELYLYKLDLSFDLRTTGTYTAYSANGSIWSGDIAGTAPMGILAQASA